MKPGNKAEARKAMNLPADAYIVGMVAANKGVPPRKAFFEQIAAFAALRKQHHDAILYLHTEDGSMGHPEQVDLVEYCRVIGLIPGKNVFFPDQYSMTLGFSDEYMAAYYNSLDVLMSVSKGEGFGLPILEAQACGVPVIVGDWTSMGELCFSGWKVSKSEAKTEYDAFFKSFWYSPNPGAVADRLFSAYEMRGNREYNKAARAGAMAYDADKVTEKYWKPVLADIEARVEYEKAAAKVETK
jgi:glycosyltransferase involved in cell wall biosynthesis